VRAGGTSEIEAGRVVHGADVSQGSEEAGEGLAGAEENTRKMSKEFTETGRQRTGQLECRTTRGCVGTYGCGGVVGGRGFVLPDDVDARRAASCAFNASTVC